MSKNQLVPVKPNLPAVFKKEPNIMLTPVMTYTPVDPLHYSFTYDFDDTVSFRMDESDNEATKNDFVEAEFDDAVPESYRKYYALAAASGVLTGALSFVKLSEEQLQRIDEWKKKDWEKYIIYAAELAGCKKKDYKSASKYLVKQSIKKINKNENTKEYMALLNAHPTMAGLFFAMISQFAGKACALSESGNLDLKNHPKYYFVGRNNSEKIVAAVLYWLFALAAGQAESGRRILDDLKIPAELLKKIKVFTKSEFLKEIPENFEEAEKAYSEWIKAILDAAEVSDEGKEDAEDKQIVIRLMKMALDLSKDAFPVLINECIVRSLFIFSRVLEVVQSYNVCTFDDLKAVPTIEFIPQDERLLSGMCLSATASFVGVNLSVAAMKAVAAAKAGDRKFLQAFITEVNIVGIGRLIFACAADSKYWGNDVKPILQRKAHSNKSYTATHDDRFESEAFNPLYLDTIQTRILYCFENIAVQKDIEKTEKTDDADKKRKWLDAWRNGILSGANIPHEYATEYFVEDEDLLYDGIYELAKDKSNFGWFYLLTQELALFEPYCALGGDDDSEYKKLKRQYDYVSDQFIRRQTIASQAELETILKTYKKYTDYMTGKAVKTITTIVGGTAATALTGGLALAFAPGIAAVIAGEAVVGLHGAALTSASLAFVGGGSIAAGGLGMAGGTAIITGGGALIGLAGSGGISATAMLMTTSHDYWVRQSAKLLTYARCTLHDRLQDKAAVQGLLTQVSQTARDTAEEIIDLKEEDNDLDSSYIKKLSEYNGYLDKVKTELEKLNK